MSFEVIETIATINNTEQTVATLTAYHPFVSLYVDGAGLAAANGSIWRLYAVSDGASVLIYQTKLTTQNAPTPLALGVDTMGALVKLTVQGTNGVSGNVTSELVGYDPSDVLTPPSVYVNANVMLNFTEQDVTTLTQNYPLLNVSVKPNSDPLANHSLWRIYALFGSTRYLLEQAQVTDTANPAILFPNLSASAPEFVLTAQGAAGVSAVNVTGVIFGSNPVTSSGGGGGGPHPPSWAQPTWFIDPQNVTGLAHDSNTGLTAGTPVLTYNGGVVAKWGTTSPVLAQNTTITWLSGQTTDADSVLFTPIPKGAIVILTASLGAAQQIHSGMLASVTAKNRATPQLLQADLGFAAPIGTRIVNTTSMKSSVAYVYKNISGTVFALSQPCTPQVPPYLHLAVEVTTWANTDTFVAYTPLSVDLVQVSAPVVTEYAPAPETVQIYGLTILDPAGLGSGSPCYLGPNVAMAECVSQRAIIMSISDDSSGDILPNNFLACDAYAGGGNASIFFGSGVLLAVNGSLVNCGFIFDAIVDASAAGIDIGSPATGLNLGAVYIASTVTLSGSSVGVNNGSPGGGSVVWGPGTLNATECVRVYYPSGGSGAETVFLCAALQVNGQSSANPFAPAAGTWATGRSLTAAALDAAIGSSGFAGLAVNVGGASFTNQGSI